MLLVTVILAFILAANSRDCVWLKSEEGAGKLTYLMKGSSGPAQFHLNKELLQTPSIQINLSESLGTQTKRMTMMINLDNRDVKKSSWVNVNNLELNVLFTSFKNLGYWNETKYLSYPLRANISLNLKMMLLVYTSEGSFIFNFGLSADQAAQNPIEASSLKLIKQKQGKLISYLLQSQQSNLLYLLFSIFFLANDFYFLHHYGKLQTSFRLSRTASALYLFSQVIYFTKILEEPQQRLQSIPIIVVLGIAAIGKIVIFILKIFDGSNNSSLRENIEDFIIIAISLTLSYSLYYLALVYCIIRDTQANAQMKYTQDQRQLSHWRTFTIILYLPAFKLIYNIPTGFPFDSAIFWWSFLFMLVYLSSICEISYRGGVKTCIHNAKYILSAQLLVCYRILQKGEVNNGKIDKLVEEGSQLDKKDDQQCKDQTKQKSK